MLAGLLLAAFQLGRVVERDDRQDATPTIEPIFVDPRIYDAYDPLDLPVDITPLGPEAAERFSVWIEPDDGRRRQRVFSSDGQILELTGSLTDAGAADFRVLYLSSGQRAEVAALVDETLAVDEPPEDIPGFGDRSTELKISATDGVRTILIDTDGPPPESETGPAARTAHLIDDLFDLSWLDPSIEPAAEPWVPPGLTVWVDPGEIDGETVAEVGPVVPWPLEGPVLSETDGVDRGPFGEHEPYRCLADAQVATLFPLLPSGTRGTMLVDDGGVVRRLALRFEFPYYVEHLDLCS